MDYVMHPELPSTPQAHHPPRGCPAWRHDHGAYLPSPHGMLSPTRNPHSPYDPVHASSGGWFPQHPFQWSPPTGPSAQPRSAHSDPYFTSMSAGLGGPAGPVQPGFLPIPQYSAPLDPFGPLHFHHRPSHQRAGGPNLSNLPNPVSQPAGQPSQSSFAPDRHSQASTPRSVGLPSVNVSLPQLQPQSQPNMSTAGDGSSSSSSSTPERRPTFNTAPDSPRGPVRQNGLFTASPLSLRSLSSHRHEAASQSTRPLSQYSEPPGKSLLYSPSNQPSFLAPELTLQKLRVQILHPPLHLTPNEYAVSHHHGTEKSECRYSRPILMTVTMSWNTFMSGCWNNTPQGLPLILLGLVIWGNATFVHISSCGAR